MKINNKELDDMTKNQVKDIYYKALCDEIDEKELQRIKNSLIEITPLCEYTKLEYIILIELLDSLSDEALDNIEKGYFRNYYKKSIKYWPGMPEDFDECDSLLNVIYSDYKKIDNKQDYYDMKRDMLTIFRDTNYEDEEIVYYLDLMNNGLCNLLKETYNIEKNSLLQYIEKYDIPTCEAYSEILENLLLTYMIYDEYEDYQLPGNLLKLIVEKLTPEKIQILASMLSIDGDTNKSKELLDMYYYEERKNRIIDINKELQLKKEYK